MRRPATVSMAIDPNMTFLLTAQPTSPPAGADIVLNQVVAILSGALAVVASYWLVLPATPQLRVRLLAQRIVRLTLRIGQSRSAGRWLRSMRAAQVRLLDFVDPATGPASEPCLDTPCLMFAYSEHRVRETELPMWPCRTYLVHIGR